MPPVIPPWDGSSGSLSAATVEAILVAEREGWATLRSQQGDPEVDVLRYVESGGDAARGVPPTKTPVAGLEGIPVLWSETTVRETVERGITYQRGDLRLEMWTDVEVFNTDVVRLPATTGVTYSVLATHYDPNAGQTLAWLRRSVGQA